MSDVQLGNMVVRLVGESRAFDNMLSRSESALVQFGRQASRVGRDLTIGLTAPLAAFATYGVRAFAQLDDAVSKATSLMGNALPVTARVREQMELVARQIAVGSVNPVEDLAGAYVDLARAGLSAEKSMSALRAVDAIMTAYGVDHAKAVELLLNSYRKLGQGETLRLVAQAYEVAKERQGSFSAQLEILKNQVKDVAIDLGEELVPVLRDLMEHVREGVAWWRALDADTKRFSIEVLAVVAALGPLLVALSSTFTAVAGVVAFFVAWGPAIASVTVFIAGWTAAVLVVVGALTTLTDALGLTDVRLGETVSKARVGGQTIGQSLTIGFLEAMKATNEWDELVERVVRYAVALFGDLGGTLYRAFINTISNMSTAFSAFLEFTGLANEIDKKRKIKNQDEWEKNLKDSLEASKQRWRDYYADTSKRAAEYRLVQVNLQKTIYKEQGEAQREAAGVQKAAVAQGPRGMSLGIVTTSERAAGQGAYVQSLKDALFNGGPSTPGGRSGDIGAPQKGMSDRQFLDAQHARIAGLTALAADKSYENNRLARMAAEEKTYQDKQARYAKESAAATGIRLPNYTPQILPEDLTPLHAARLASGREFEQTSFSRFTMNPVSGGAQSKKTTEVSAPDVVKRLDTLIDLTKGKTVAVLGP